MDEDRDTLLHIRGKLTKQIEGLSKTLETANSSLKQVNKQLEQLLKEDYEKIIKSVVEGRAKFIYDNGYGTTTDIYMLPIGIKFNVINGAWSGEIIEENGIKKMWIAKDRKVELEEDFDYSLVIRIDN